MSRKIKEYRPFIQGGRWNCGACWHERQSLRFLYASGCSCGFKRPEWVIPFEQALGYALRAFRDQEMACVDGCFVCEGGHYCHHLEICTKCGAETFMGWQMKISDKMFDLTENNSKYPINDFRP